MSEPRYPASLEQRERREEAPRASLSLRLPAGADVDALVARLVVRHELLRSRLVTLSDGPLVQEVLDGASPDVAVEVSASEFSLSLPSRSVDLGGLAVLAGDLSAMARGDALAEPVQNSQYAAWQAGNQTADRVSWQPPVHVQRPALSGDPGTPADRRAVIDGIDAAFVDALAGEIGVDPEDLLLAAWSACLWRFGGDHTCGVYVDTRTRYPDLATMVGVCSRYLPLGASFAVDEPAREAVQRVAGDRRRLAEQAGGFRWRNVPRGEFGCDPRAPQAPVLFAWVDAAAGLELDGVRLHDPSHEPGLALLAIRSGALLRLELRHRTDIVAPATAAAIAEGYVELLRDLAAAPDRPIGELALLSPEGSGAVLAGFGRPPEPAPVVDAHPNELFAAQVRRTPDRLAVVDAARSYTYGELEVRAADVAHALGEHGVEAGERVALRLDRNVDMVAAVLGVWRAGAAFVPVTADMPDERLAFVLSDSGARLLLTDVPVPPGIDVDVLDITSVATGVAPPASEDRPAGDLAAEAYVIYTSGTTGRPKGVVVEHRSVVNLALAHRERIYRHHDPDGVGMRVSLAASLAFDGAVERITLLLSGHTLHVVDDETRRDPSAFLAFVREHRLDVVDLTPSFLTLLVRAGLSGDAGHRPAVALVGGEAINPSLWQELAASPIAFYNVYGPTEATVNAAVGRVVGSDPHLGPALPGARLYVLDPARRPVPVGVPGEIHVAGAGVARGYLNRPELSEAKFVANPFVDTETAYGRLYCTGDLGRFLPDGSIEFLGRSDGQVSIRGYRVESEEVANVLREDPDVTDALVRLHTSAHGTPSLVAYVGVGSAGRAGLVERLQGRLTARLPDYMVPGGIVVLDRLPLTANGKVDTAALPAPDAARSDMVSTPYVAPDGAVEKGIAAIWEEVLETTGVGVSDNFFDLGGDSLLAAEMIAFVNEEFGVELPLSSVFTAPCIADLAVAVSQELG